jgi:hypothetical protein
VTGGNRGIGYETCKVLENSRVLQEYYFLDGEIGIQSRKNYLVLYFTNLFKNYIIFIFSILDMFKFTITVYPIS